jgi:hypothetical protein
LDEKEEGRKTDVRFGKGRSEDGTDKDVGDRART